MASGNPNIHKYGKNTQWSKDHRPPRPRGKGWKKAIEDQIDGDGGFLEYTEAELMDADGNPTGTIVHVRVKVTVRDQLIKYAIDAVKDGNMRALDFLADRTEGKPTQTTQLLGAGQNPLFDILTASGMDLDTIAASVHGLIKENNLAADTGDETESDESK